MKSYLIPITLLVLATLIQAEPSLKDTDGAWSLLGVSGYAGQITMNSLTGSSIFFWFFESLNTNIATDSRPLIIWLDGGPGCSGSYTMIWEAVAPIYVNTNTEPLRTNTNITWATSYHLLMIDFPYGTGFSYANSESDLRNNTFDATFYLYKFLLKLGKKYPAWFNREIFIFGESYGGHWVPGISYHITQQNALNPSLYINLKGIGIGGAWVNPKIQSQTWASYGLSTGNINDNQASILQYYQNLISIQISNNQFVQASESFNNVISTFEGFTSGLNVYNVRTYEDDDLTNFENWITSSSTRKMLNVGNTPWTFCNRTVNQYFNGDITNSTDPYLSYVLESGVRAIIYGGQDDFIVNTPGAQNMVAALKWTGISSYLSAPKNVWTVNGDIAGYVQTNTNLTFVMVVKSGHDTSHDQPIHIKNLVETFVNGTSWK